MDAKEGMPSPEEDRISSCPEHAGESDKRVTIESNAEDGRLSGQPNVDEEWIREKWAKLEPAFRDSVCPPSDFKDESEPKICRLPVRDSISRPRLETAGGLSQPSVVAIGPFHWGPEIRISDNEKWAIVFLMDRLYGRLKLWRSFKTIKSQVAKARNCYSSSDISKSQEARERDYYDGHFKFRMYDKFNSQPHDSILVEILLLDSYFILFMLTIKLRKGATDYTLMSLIPDIQSEFNVFQNDTFKFLDIICDKDEIALDLLIFDNQIPFFVIEELFKELNLDKPLHEYAVEFFETIHPRSARHCKDHQKSLPKFLHLLDLFHWSRVPENKYIKLISSSTDRAALIPSRFGRREHTIPIEEEKHLGSIDQAGHIPNATELRESAIVFEKNTSDSSLDITFRRRRFQRIIRVLSIPELHVLDYSSIVFYNLIVFEIRSSTRGRGTMAFSALMWNLLQSEEDVRLLRRRGILVSSSMTDKQLLDFFEFLSRLTKNHRMPCDLSDIYRQVRSHHRRLVSRLCGGIILQYFSKPVVTLSVFVAALLFIPTLLQTIYAMKYHN